MFTDIVGYSRLMGQNESLTIQLVEHYRRILVGCIERHGGRVIEFIGDAVFASFAEAQASVDAAIEIQQALDQFNTSKDKDQKLVGAPLLRTRIGLHSGEVTLKDGAPFGDDVNIAARLEPLAYADGICISEAVYEQIKQNLRYGIKALGKQTLKNIENKISVYLIRPQGLTAKVHAHYALKRVQQQINKHRYGIAACFLCLIVAGFYFIPRWLVPGYTANYVEIADFKNLMSEGGESDYFSAGITEALRSQLADMEDVYILDPADGVRGPVRLEGSVQRAGENVRIAYRLFRRKDNVQIAGGKLDGVYDDIFILQDRVVAEIAQFISKEFDLKYFRPASLKPTENTLAYEYYMRGLDYLQRPQTNENFDQAINNFTTALVHDKEYSLANSGICRTYHEKFKLSKNVSFIGKSEASCSLALVQDENSYEALLGMGLIYADKGDFDKSIIFLEAAIGSRPKSVEALSVLASLYERSGEFEKAEKELIEVMRKLPDYWAAYVEYSYLLIGQGRLFEAISVLESALDLTPENEPALSNLGVAYLYVGEPNNAAKAFEKASEIVPSPVIYSNIGSSHYYSRNFLLANEAYLKAIKMSPGDYRLYVNAADALRYVPSRRDEVVRLARQALKLTESQLELNENDFEAHTFKSVAHFLIGEYIQSEFHLNRAYEIRPNDIEVLYTSMRISSLIGNNEKAIEYFSQLVSLGYPIDLILSDPDFEALQNDKKFLEVVNITVN